MRTEYMPKHNAFSPVEIAAADGSTSLRSRMCHDFVTDALWVLYENGVNLSVTEPVFRDHIIMYSSKMSPVDQKVWYTRGKRQWMRYLRTLYLFIEGIKEQFTFARAALVVVWKAGVPAFLHTPGQDYEVTLVPPFLNYCYLPLAIPPEKHDPFGSMKLCALSMTANLTNESIPLPWAPLLAAEERLDQPVAMVSMLLVIVFAACCQAAGAGADGPSGAGLAAEAKRDQKPGGSPGAARRGERRRG